MLADAEASRAGLALAVTDGKLSGEMFRELRDVSDELRLDIERIDLAVPTIEARYAAAGAMTERTANALVDAQAGLTAAVKAAKLERAVAQGA